MLILYPITIQNKVTKLNKKDSNTLDSKFNSGKITLCTFLIPLKQKGRSVFLKLPYAIFSITVGGKEKAQVSIHTAIERTSLIANLTSTVLAVHSDIYYSRICKYY